MTNQEMKTPLGGLFLRQTSREKVTTIDNKIKATAKNRHIRDLTINC
jgi:hypothetical protein